MAAAADSTDGGNVIRLNKNHIAVDEIDMHLVEAEAMVDGLRLLWENVARTDPAVMDELQSIAVTMSFVIKDKLAAARRCVPSAYVHRIRAGRKGQ